VLLAVLLVVTVLVALVVVREADAGEDRGESEDNRSHFLHRRISFPIAGSSCIVDAGNRQPAHAMATAPSETSGNAAPEASKL
jgi:hypothetical protein